MTINAIQLNTSTPFTGLGTFTYNVLTAGLYTVAVVVTIPYQPAGSSYNSAQTPPNASNLQIVVNQNGTPELTVGGTSPSSPTPTQPQISGTVRLQCAVNDVITVVTSSSFAVDAQPNQVKGTINLYQGE